MYFVTILLFNVCSYVYLIIFMFSVFFLFDIKYFRTLNEFKGFNNIQFISISLILIFLSLAGIPPLMGFIGKFLLFLLITSTYNIFFIIIFTLMNLFFMFFYLQNIRFIVSKQRFKFFNLKNYFVYYDWSLISLLVLFSFINIFGIFFFNHIFIYLYNVVGCLFLY